MKKIIVFASIGLGFLFATCCSTMNILKSDSETTQTLQGKTVLKDTPDLWDEFRGIVSRDIQRELEGRRAQGGGTWNERWMGSIKSLREGNRENYPKYIDYIINERKRQGLSNLE